MSSPVKSLLTKCQIKNCYKHFLNRSIESTSIPTPLTVYYNYMHNVNGFFEVNEIVLWAAFWADSWQIVSVLRAGRGRYGAWGWYVALAAWRLF